MLSRLPAEERRAQLIQAALSRAERDGFGAVTIRRVADDAGVSLGVVHYCFANKDELMSAAIESIIEGLTSAVRAALSAPPPGEASVAGDNADAAVVGVAALSDMLKAGVRRMWAMIEATPGLQLLTYEITTYALRRGQGSASDEAARSRGLAAQQYVFTSAETVDFLEEGARHTGTRWTESVEGLARMCLAYIDGAVLRWLIDRDSAAATAGLDVFIEMLVARAAVDAADGPAR